MNIAPTKLHEMADTGVVRPGDSLRVTDRRGIDANDPAAELLRQVTRRPATPTADVQHLRLGSDPGPPTEGEDLVRSQQALLPNVGRAVHKGRRGQPTAPQRVIELASCHVVAVPPVAHDTRRQPGISCFELPPARFTDPD